MQPLQNTAVRKISYAVFEGPGTTVITLQTKSTFLSLAYTHVIKTVCPEVGNRKVELVYEYKHIS
jgi:hypothetical protein